MFWKQNHIVRHVLFLMLLLGTVSGCAVRFAYNQLDWAIPWYLSGYMALSGDQKDRFQARLNEYLYWHRIEQLPLYVAFLRKVSIQAEDGLDLAEIADAQLQAETFANTLVVAMVPHVVALFSSATERQVELLFSKFDEDNQRFRRENIDVPDALQRKKAADDAMDYVERWVGTLNDKQENKVLQWGKQYQPMGAELLDARLAWQQAFRDILVLRLDQPVAFEQQLGALLQNSQFGRSAALNAKFAHNREASISLYQALDASLTPAQRKRLLKTLRNYAEDFEILSKETRKENASA